MAVLLPGIGSVTQTGAVTVAVLTSEPVADGAMLAETVYVTEAPAGRLRTSLMLPLPEAVLPLAPPDEKLVHVAEVIADGKISLKPAPVTLEDPALLAVMVYVTDCPGTPVVTPSVLVIDKSAMGTATVKTVASFSPDSAGSPLPLGSGSVPLSDKSDTVPPSAEAVT